jgi:hypothetical protein
MLVAVLLVLVKTSLANKIFHEQREKLKVKKKLGEKINTQRQLDDTDIIIFFHE